MSLSRPWSGGANLRFVSETINYTVERKVEDVELRRYPPMVLATVRGMADNDAFRILFGYISGRNHSDKKIPMTAPVISTEARIPMTAPVISAPDSFSFVLPPSYPNQEIPAPLDPRSTLERIPQRRVAALRFRGIATRNAVAEKTRQLLDTLAQHEIPTDGSAFLMRYNAPFTPGFMRRNEVGIEVRAS